MAASQRSAPKRGSNTTYRKSSASSSGSSTFPSTQPTSIETSPVSSPQLPTYSNGQPIYITSGQAQEPSNPTNSDTPPANTGPGPATTQSKKKAVKAPKATKAPKAKTALTHEQKLDRHKRAEAIRRNELATITAKVDGWIPDSYRNKNVKKANNKTEMFESAANWLRDMKAGNAELERQHNELLETLARLNEGQSPPQADLQEQQHDQQQQQFQPTKPSPYQQQQPAVGAGQFPTPPIDSPTNSQELAFRPPPPTHYGNVQWGHGNQQPGFSLSSQQANLSPPIPPQPYIFDMSEAGANRMFENALLNYNQAHGLSAQQQLSLSVA